MRARIAIASILALGCFGCGGADEGVAEREPGAYESPESLSPQTPGESDPAAAIPDVATSPSPTDEAPGVSGDDTDVEITRKIREQLVAGDEPLSEHAQNVVVDAEQGVVTLSGPVENEREKEIVLTIARSTEGVTRVEDRLEIAQR
jgi:hypothetical protein